MSAAAKPEPWGVSRQPKGRELNPTGVALFTLLTWRGVLLRIPGVAWGGKGERNDIHRWIASDGSELLPTTDVQFTLPYLTLPYLTLPYLTLPYLTLPYLTLPYPVDFWTITTFRRIKCRASLNILSLGFWFADSLLLWLHGNGFLRLPPDVGCRWLQCLSHLCWVILCTHSQACGILLGNKTSR
jgi:hypothetical protein